MEALLNQGEKENECAWMCSALLERERERESLAVTQKYLGERVCVCGWMGKCEWTGESE